MIWPFTFTAFPMVAAPRGPSSSGLLKGVLDIVGGVASFFSGMGVGSGGAGFGVIVGAAALGGSSSLRLFHILMMASSPDGPKDRKRMRRQSRCTRPKHEPCR